MKPILATLILLFPLMASDLGYFKEGQELEIRLTNGNNLRGVLKSAFPAPMLRLQTEDESLFVFGLKEIETIKDADLSGKHHSPTAARVDEFGKKKGPYLRGSVGIYGLFPGGWSLVVDGGYQVNPYFSFGGGAGALVSSVWKAAPVFVETRFKLPIHRISLSVYGRTGLDLFANPGFYSDSIYTNTSLPVAPFLGFGAGLTIYLTRSIGTFAELGVRIIHPYFDLGQYPRYEIECRVGINL